MVKVVKSLVGTDVNYAQAQVRSLGDKGLRLQIPLSDGGMVELSFDVPLDVHQKVKDLLAHAVEAAKPIVKEISKTKVVIAVPLTLEERVANIEKFLSTILILN